MTCSLTRECGTTGGAVGSSLPLGTLRQHKQHRTKTPIGQQALPKAKPKQKPKGQAKASKLRISEKNNFMEKMQLALLEPDDPRGSLDQNTAKDLSLRIFLTLSLMKKWRLKTVRIQTALPQQLTSTQLRGLGLRETEVDSQIFVGDQLGVFQHGETWLIGGEQMQQEACLHKLSASFTLTDTQQLEQNNPLSFMRKTLEFNQAERNISLYLPTAFYSDLMSRYSLEEATTRSTPTEQLGCNKNQALQTNCWRLDLVKHAETRYKLCRAPTQQKLHASNRTRRRAA